MHTLCALLNDFVIKKKFSWIVYFLPCKVCHGSEMNIYPSHPSPPSPSLSSFLSPITRFPLNNVWTNWTLPSDKGQLPWRYMSVYKYPLIIPGFMGLFHDALQINGKTSVVPRLESFTSLSSIWWSAFICLCVFAEVKTRQLWLNIWVITQIYKYTYVCILQCWNERYWLKKNLTLIKECIKERS